MSNNELLALLGPEKEKIDAAMQTDLADIRSPLLKKVVEHGIFNGGKRVRPIFVVLAAKTCDYGKQPSAINSKELYRLAMVFEYLHAASLLHDDVIDHADQRRGKKTANSVWGNTPVILAGDYLHTKAMMLAGGVGGQECLTIIAQATSAMVEAEFLQMQNAENKSWSKKDYFDVLQGKTAALIAAACETGAVFGGGDNEQRRRMRRFGENLGLAFQIVDDLLDYLGDPSQTGKIVGNDLIEGKITLPLIITLSKADNTDKNTIIDILKSDKEKKAQSIRTVKNLIDKYGGFEDARATAEHLISSAIGELDSFTPCVEKDILAGLAKYVLTRKK